MSNQASQCPFQVGDKVIFQPTLYAIAKLAPLEFYGVEMNQVGRIVKIKDGRYIYLESSKSGLDWELFGLVERAGGPENKP